MKLNKLRATPDEKDSVIRAITWCRENGLAFAGLPYTDELAGPGGIHLELLVPDCTGREICEQALREAYRERDVVSHSVKVCPAAWFAEAEPDLRLSRERRYVNYYAHCGMEWTTFRPIVDSDDCPVCGQDVAPRAHQAVELHANDDVPDSMIESVDALLARLAESACVFRAVEEVEADIASRYDADTITAAVKRYGIGFRDIAHVYQSMLNHTD